MNHFHGLKVYNIALEYSFKNHFHGLKVYKIALEYSFKHHFHGLKIVIRFSQTNSTCPCNVDVLAYWLSHWLGDPEKMGSTPSRDTQFPCPIIWKEYGTSCHNFQRVFHHLKIQFVLRVHTSMRRLRSTVRDSSTKGPFIDRVTSLSITITFSGSSTPGTHFSLPPQPNPLRRTRTQSFSNIHGVRELNWMVGRKGVQVGGRKVVAATLLCFQRPSAFSECSHTVRFFTVFVF